MSPQWVTRPQRAGNDPVTVFFADNDLDLREVPGDSLHAMADPDGNGVLAQSDCRDLSEMCDGPVEWQTDGAKRCSRHQLLYERSKRRRLLLTGTIAVVVIVVAGMIVNLLIRPDEGPSQARAWEICLNHAAANLDLPAGAMFAELPTNPSEAVKIQLGSNRYDVWSRYENADGTRRRFHCTVAYQGSDDWEVLRFDVEPSG